MNNNKNISINMSTDEVKDIIRFYLCTKGHMVDRDDIEFNIYTRECDRENVVDGCTVKI